MAEVFISYSRKDSKGFALQLRDALEAAERMAWLNHAAADFQLFALDERSEELESVDFRDIGNLESRLVRAFSRSAAIERCQPGINRLMNLLVDGARNRVEVLATSPTHVGLLLNGLEFARVHHWRSPESRHRFRV